MTDWRYDKWTQWIFLQIYNSWFNPETKRAELISTYRGADPDSVRLAYIAEVPVNWCPELGTVLANEEVVDGKSEVGGFPVVRRPMRQWMLRITTYAQRLLDGLDDLDWPEGIKLFSEIGSAAAKARRWISKWIKRHKIPFAPASRHCFTARRSWCSRPSIRSSNNCYRANKRRPCAPIANSSARKSDLDRGDLHKDNTASSPAGVRSESSKQRTDSDFDRGLCADRLRHRRNRGRARARRARTGIRGKFDLPIVEVVQPLDDEPALGFVGDGIAVNSPIINGLASAEAKRKITAWLQERGQGKRAINYKLRDWLFSRQRYWGEPFPIVWEGLTITVH